MSDPDPTGLAQRNGTKIDLTPDPDTPRKIGSADAIDLRAAAQAGYYSYEHSY